MSFDPQSPSDAADMAPDAVLLCEFCDEVIDQIDVNVEVFERMGGAACCDCFDNWNYAYPVLTHDH